jgi:hypothetical protein
MAEDVVLVDAGCNVFRRGNEPKEIELLVHFLNEAKVEFMVPVRG